MDNTVWLKQTSEKALFGDMLWSRPQNRTQAGKLLIIGGRVDGLAAPAKAYAAAVAAGIGSIRVVLPAAARRAVGKAVPEAEFAPATARGSFSRQALTALLDSTKWADGVLLAGDFGHNSETTLLIEASVNEYKGPLTLVGDAADALISHQPALLAQPKHLAVLNFSQLQKLAQQLQLTAPITSTMSLHNLVQALAEWTANSKLQIISGYQDQLVVACGGRVSTTPSQQPPNWVELAAYTSVWHLQNPTKPFEALTTAVFEFLNGAPTA